MINVVRGWKRITEDIVHRKLVTNWIDRLVQKIAVVEYSWITRRQRNMQTDTWTGRQADRPTDRHTDRHTQGSRQTDIDKQIGRQADR